MYLAPHSEKQKIRDNPGMMLKTMTERTPILAYVGSDFGPDTGSALPTCQGYADS